MYVVDKTLLTHSHSRSFIEILRHSFSKNLIKGSFSSDIASVLVLGFSKCFNWYLSPVAEEITAATGKSEQSCYATI